MPTELIAALETLLSMPPLSYALIAGGPKYPSIHGVVYFYPLWNGSFVMAEVSGLPIRDNLCPEAFFAFHIHQGNVFQGTEEDPFSQVGSHYNPYHCPHPSHAGDLPLLLGNEGYALSFFYTQSFHPLEVVGHTVIIHDKADDYHSQPAGDSGAKIACGEIRANQWSY